MKKIIFAGMFFLATLCAYSTTNVAIERRFGAWIISVDAGDASETIQFFDNGAFTVSEQPITKKQLSLAQVTELRALIVNLEATPGEWNGTIDPLVKSRELKQTPISGGGMGFNIFDKKDVKLPWSDFSKNAMYFFFKVKVDNVDQWVVNKVSTEFFPGEKALFGDARWGAQANLSHNQKSLIFLNKVLEGLLKNAIDADTFLMDSMPEGAPPSAAWNIFVSTWDIKNQILAFKTEISRHFPQQYESMKIPGTNTNGQGLSIPLVYLGLTKDDFNNFYGSKLARNIYLSSYIWMIFKQNIPKPIFSQVIADQIKNENYFYQDYRPLALVDGNKVAEAALRYLTWAPDYTRADGGESLQLMNDMTDYKEQIQSWISDSSTQGDFKNNFLPAGITTYSMSRILNNSGFNLSSPYSRTETIPSAGTRQVGVPGNPLAYLRFGFDTPRTFTWKLNEQREARKLMVAKEFLKGANGYSGPSFRALDNQNRNENYYNYYTSEFEMLNFAMTIPANKDKWNIGTILKTKSYDTFSIPQSSNMPRFGTQRAGAADWVPKPFLPGDFGPDRKLFGPWGPLGYLKGAGVDSIGMVLGAASMAGIPLRNYSNIETTENLNTFSRMSDTANSNKGLDETGKPKYWSSGADDWINLHWTKTDFERNTILVPDVHLIQPGDLLVSYNSNRHREQEYDADEINDMHIGVVVSVPASFKKQTDAASEPVGAVNASDIWSKINVVSVRPGLRTVTLGSWGNGSNMFGGFTATPENYQIRRLMKWIGPIARTNTRQAYELIETRTVGLNVSLEYKNGGYGRFIPNTGEPLEFKTVKVFQQDANGNEIKFNGDHLKLALLPPKDAYSITANPQANPAVVPMAGNISNNTGGGLEYLVNDKVGNVDNWKVVARFIVNPAYTGLADNLIPRYYRDPTPIPVNSAVSGDFIIQSVDNSVIFLKSDGTRLNQWGIRPQTPGGTISIKPGDDFFIGFGLKEANGEPVVGYAETQRLAIYDKKLVWRANLYVNENDPDLRDQDWNNALTWNAPPSANARANNLNPSWGKRSDGNWDEAWGYNEWNRVRNRNPANISDVIAPAGDWSSTGYFSDRPEGVGAGINTLEATYLTNTHHPTIGNGGQVVTFHHWTRFNNGDLVNNTVAYGWGSNDNPFEFDEEVLEQKARISARRTADNNDNNVNTDYGTLEWPDSNGAPRNLGQESNWDNYIFPTRRFTLDGERVYFDYGGTAAVDNLPNDTINNPSTESQHPYHLPIGTTVSVPGLSTFLTYFEGAGRDPGNGPTTPLSVNWHEAPEPPPPPPPPGQFPPVNYKNYNWSHPLYTSGVDCSGFVWRSMMYSEHPYNNVLVGGILNQKQTASGFMGADRSFQISGTTIQGSIEPANLKYVIPGDIIVKNGHITLVTNVIPDPDGTVTRRDQIRMIQAHRGNEIWRVSANLVWGLAGGMGPDYYDYSVRRLGIQE